MSNLSVLIIEDNPLNQELFKDILEIEGCDVLVATDAETGIVQALNSRPDVILMDIQLPGMDGLKATEIIKDDPALNTVPVIALTAHAMHGDKEKAFDAGCIGYVTKPVSTRTFYQEIISFLDGQPRERC